MPSDLFAGHAFELSKMRLLPGVTKEQSPLIVHWAGTGSHRLWVAGQRRG